MALPTHLARRDSGPARFADGRLGFAVGDIHGRADLLRLMLDRLEEERREAGDREPLLIFLGDYVDRGADTANVIELLLEVSTPASGFDARFLMGNHEAAMLGFVDNPIANRAWLLHGGLETLASYRVAPLPRIGASDETVREAARNLELMMPRTHWDFLRQLKRLVLVGDYAFVHAGIDCGRAINDQSDEDLLWARHRFLTDKRRSSHIIVHGHTPVEVPYRDERRIGIDTGAYATGKLSAARFWREHVSFITVG